MIYQERLERSDAVLWHVEGSRLTLMGSIHLLEQTRHGLYPDAERIYQRVERVTFEHDMVTAPDPAFLENGMGKRLSTQVPADVFAHASRAWANLGLDPARLEQLQPWVAAIAIVITGASRRGIEEAYGIDKVLWGRAEQDGKTRTTLEKPDEALAIFSSLSAYEATSFLDYSTNPVTAFQNDLDVMMKAWHEHDEVTLERILDHRLRMWPAGFAQLITGRNLSWMPTLLQLAADNVPTLVVVGALHCVGMNGLPRLVEKQGSRLSRII